jgi:hypothetical protein
MKYIGIRLYKSLVKRTSYEKYWDKESICTKDTIVQKAISRNRFEEIKRHFCLYSESDIEMSKTNKVTIAQTAIDFLNHRFKMIYSPGKELSLDEGMCPWKGRLRCKTYSPNKPDKYGIKCYMLCESKTVYILRFKIHSASTTLSSVFKELLEPYYYKNHVLYMDNFYNSVFTTQKLLDVGI